ncbi:DUF6255 family natural product biosynthesis protein [Streptomyces luteoverticillatus]|uniref:DUF6255 family natural product biosynthesis protein n=1 Tax=Streptomyces luteoverticillatus TaxID=66425 RepID=UPI003D36A124
MQNDQGDALRSCPTRGYAEGPGHDHGHGATPAGGTPVTAVPSSHEWSPTYVNCPHPETECVTGIGAKTCGRCGTQRVTDYRTLAHALELPERVALCASTTSGMGHVRGAVPVRRSALLRKLRETNRRSRRGRP